MLGGGIRVPAGESGVWPLSVESFHLPVLRALRREFAFKQEKLRDLEAPQFVFALPGQERLQGRLGPGALNRASVK